MKTRKVKVIDDYHGTKVADPFRWLEDADSPEVQAWADQQMKRTREFLDRHPRRQQIVERMRELWNYTQHRVPYRKGDHYYFFRNDGSQNQPVLCRVRELADAPEQVLDPNQLSEDGTVALMNYSVSRDSRLMAYSLSTSGSDWQEIRVRDLSTGQDLADHIKWCKFTSLYWKPDSSGFFYTRFPEPGTVAPEDESRNNKVYFHRIGTPQEQDQLVYERPDNPDLSFTPVVTEDGRFLILYVSQGTAARNRVYYKELDRDGEFIRLLDDNDAIYRFLGTDDTVFYFVTDLDAPRRRIIAIDASTGQLNEVIPQEEDAIANAAYIAGHFVVVRMHHAAHQVKIYSKAGELIREIPLPTLGAVTGLSGEADGDELFFGFASFLYPETIFRFDFNRNEVETLWAPDIDFDADQYVTHQVFYTSRDGTRVPMFLTHKKDLELDGNNPTLLYGYGGFNIARLPEFRVPDLVWFEMGGILAVANLRGGSEYGEEWHRAGMLHNKQNVFDDFIAAAEWLIENKYTSRKKLAIKGRSNGGLLTAACMVQRPELYGAVISQVPVIDMLRYHKFTVGRFWIPEYGDAEHNPEHFKFLYKYSPLHNVRFGAVYPPIMIMTAKSDDRVVPAHAMKFAATLQEVAISDNPILLRVEEKAGHGQGKPKSKLIEEQADVYTFLDIVLNG